MGPLARFFEYAQAFELSYDDDDWSRIEPFFAPDAVYEVRNVPFACRLVGPKAIVAGFKKSLDGFDRRMPKRVAVPVGMPTEDGDTMRADWTATYEKPGAPTFVLRGRSIARYRDGLIVELVDEYPDGMSEEAGAWITKHAPGLYPFYV